MKAKRRAEKATDELARTGASHMTAAPHRESFLLLRKRLRCWEISLAPAPEVAGFGDSVSFCRDRDIWSDTISRAVFLSQVLELREARIGDWQPPPTLALAADALWETPACAVGAVTP